ncbi:MAG: IS110 family transposase [Clostridia bacterium]|nr:IS110 family transposase [Clostridia bacterium]
MRQVCTIGLDIAKNVFQVYGEDKSGHKIFNKKISRANVLTFFANLPICLIGIEACGSAHYWARKLLQQGHIVKIVSPHLVRPFVINNKTDAADARAICEVIQRPDTKFVPVKSIEQQEIAALHCVRERLVGNRTALVNQIRALLYEQGIVYNQGIKAIEKALPELLSQGYEYLSDFLIGILQELWNEYHQLDDKINLITQKIEGYAKANEHCKRIMKIAGVGPLTATAVVAKYGTARQFKNGRQFSAFLGLTPKEHSSGGKQKLLGISKRGDVYLRKLLIQGARVICRLWNSTDSSVTLDRRKIWIQSVTLRRGNQKAIVAQANKTARIIWNVLAKGEEYNPLLFE